MSVPPEAIPQNHVTTVDEQAIPPEASSATSDEPTLCLLIDNYDSFTFNLYQYLCQLGADMVVKRNDEITLAEVEVSASAPDANARRERPRLMPQCIAFRSRRNCTTVAGCDPS
jgi:hypothetical protein